MTSKLVIQRQGVNSIRVLREYRERLGKQQDLGLGWTGLSGTHSDLKSGTSAGRRFFVLRPEKVESISFKDILMAGISKSEGKEK